MDKNWIGGLRCRASEQLIAKPTSIKGTGGKSGGWKSYFGFCQIPSLLKALEEWMCHRLRSMLWKQWKRGKTRSCVISGSVGTWPHKRRAVRTALGIWRTVRPCPTRFPSLTSIRLVSPRLFDGDA
jgi:Group II intron, maturase-specific domain